MLPVRRQRGSILIMTAVFIVVLIAVAALAIDVGRLVVLRSQLQNAADAAAIAAAVELDGKDGARERAMAAAREAISHDQSFARIQDLLGAAGLPDAAFSFFCVIGAEYDVDPDEVTNLGIYCSGADDGSGRYPAGTDTESHYVRVDLDPALLDDAAGRFTLDLFFLPVLQLFTPATATEAAVRAMAVAGKHSIQCNYPPMALCDPFEGAGGTFKNDMPVGTTIKLRDQGAGAAWAPGNFAFLATINGEKGADKIAEALAFPEDDGCAPRSVTFAPGQKVNKTTAAINTRFDMYGPHFSASADPLSFSAPNIYEYENTDVASPVAGLNNDDRFRQPGGWNYEAWKTAQVAMHGALIVPPEWAATQPLMWDVYKWEIANNRILKNPVHTPAGSPERRELAVAVVSCAALNVTGSKTVPINSPDGYAKLFIYKSATDTPDAEIYGEYVGWFGEGDSNYHVEVQLYE